VIVSPNCIKKIDWETGALIINTTTAHVNNSPEYNPE